MRRGENIGKRGLAAGETPVKQSQNLDYIVERLEVLTGERGDANRTGAAVRRSDLDAIASRANTMASTQITAAPTQANYNALQKDVAALFAAILELSNSLGTR